MRLVSFDAFRTLGLGRLVPVRQIKAEHFLRHRAEIEAADWALFPRTWQLNVLCYAWKRRVFPSPVSYDIGYDKIEQTRAFEALAPANVPLTLILPCTATAQEEALDILGLPLVVKEPRNSMGLGVRRIETAAELRAWCTAQSVLYAQELLPLTEADEQKGNGDLRIVWVGDRVVTAYWRRGGNGLLHNVAQGATLDFSGIPGPALALVHDVATTLGVDHAGFDIAWISGHPYLLELNVLFGNTGLRQAGIDLAPVLRDWLDRSAGGATAPGEAAPDSPSGMQDPGGRHEADRLEGRQMM
jgi:ribosomal protein S6--L-glutamate ligase